MKFEVEQVTEENEEMVKVYCHDTRAQWVKQVHEAVSGQKLVCGNKEGKTYQIKLSDVYYFEVVDGKSFIYTRKDVFTAKEKLYEFEEYSLKSSLFRCSKSMILNLTLRQIIEAMPYVTEEKDTKYYSAMSMGVWLWSACNSICVGGGEYCRLYREGYFFQKRTSTSYSEYRLRHYFLKKWRRCRKMQLGTV